MGKSLVMTLLKRHVNIYSDLYTLCFFIAMYKAPVQGWALATSPSSGTRYLVSKAN